MLKCSIQNYYYDLVVIHFSPGHATNREKKNITNNEKSKETQLFTENPLSLSSVPT